jgi:D-sedoheptulose 7-phosphate isomerase
LKKCRQILIEAIRRKKTIFFVGNGGSDAIAAHMACDYGKGLRRFYGKNLNVYSLACNGHLHTALCNDFGHENGFAAEIEMYGRKGDVIFLISSSGNSENIIRACNKANELSITTIGLSGFSGGQLKDIADIPIYFDVYNYPAVELLHQNFLDMVCLSLNFKG